jgi:type IV fimbrial biogenesis protein FimT
MRARGFTTTELMIVLAILGILTAMAAPSMATLMRTQRLRTASFDLMAGLQLARSEAIKRNSAVTITPVGGNWAGGWVSTDANNNVVQRQDPVASCSACTFTGPDTVVYTASGRLSAGSAPQFAITSTELDASKHRCINLDLSGRPVSKYGAC